MSEFHLAPEAEAELDAIWLHIARASGSVDLATRVVEDITERFWLLARYPYLGRGRDEDLRLGLRRIGANGTTTQAAGTIGAFLTMWHSLSDEASYVLQRSCAALILAAQTAACCWPSFNTTLGSKSCLPGCLTGTVICGSSLNHWTIKDVKYRPSQGQQALVRPHQPAG